MGSARQRTPTARATALVMAGLIGASPSWKAIYFSAWARSSELNASCTISGQALAVTLAAGLALGLLWQLAEPGMRYAKGYLGDRRGPAYTALAAWLDENAAPTDSVAYIRVDTALHLPSP